MSKSKSVRKIPVVNATSRSALVVGGSTSIGTAVLRRLSSNGITVLSTARTLPSAGERLPSVQYTTLDLSQEASLDALAGDEMTRFGKLDIVVFLAGILPGKSLENYDDALMHEVLNINFIGQAALLRRILSHLKNPAHIIFVSSVSAERGSFDPVYAASKAAQIAFVKSCAVWLAPKVRVNAIAPALIDDSSMFLSMAPERRKYHLDQTPTGRLTTKEDISAIIYELCGEAWSNLNGQVIRINGGAHV